MTTGFKKLVNFEKCKTCKYKGTNEQDEPCEECISTPARDVSHTPIHYEEETK